MTVAGLTAFASFLLSVLLRTCIAGETNEYQVIGGYPECKPPNLLISPSDMMGLHNQVDLLVNSIYVGLMTNRNVCMRGFKPQFDKTDMISVAMIYNLQTMNHAIEASGIKRRIHESFNISSSSNPGSENPFHLASIIGPEYQEATCLELHGEGAMGQRNCPGQKHGLKIRQREPNYTGIVAFLQRDDISQMPCVAVTNGVPFVRTGFEETIDDAFIHEIHLMVKFQPIFYEVRDWLLVNENGMKPGEPYTSVHFRLENDGLNQYHTFNAWEYEEVESVVKAGFTFNWTRPEHDIFVTSKFLQTVINTVPKDEKIHICSGLGKGQHNRVNFILPLLKDYYKGNMFSNNMLNLELAVAAGLPIEGREVAAIIDYIFAGGATNFIGISLSTFSGNAMRLIKTKRGIKDLYYGRTDGRLHDRAINAKAGRKKQPQNSEELAAFAEKSVLFSIRDMGLPPFQPTEIGELDKMLTIPGLISGIDFIEKFHHATKVDADSRREPLMSRPFQRMHPNVFRWD